MQFISKDLIGQTLGCHNCKSINIFAQYSRHNCNKGNFKRKEIKIHSNCGKIIDIKRFQHEGQLICVHCDTLFDSDPSKLKDINGYQCKICNNVFLQPCITVHLQFL